MVVICCANPISNIVESQNPGDDDKWNWDANAIATVLLNGRHLAMSWTKSCKY